MRKAHARSIVSATLVLSAAVSVTSQLPSGRAAAPSGTARPWVADSLHRVSPIAKPQPGRTAHLHAARRQTVSFQVVVPGGARGVSGVTLSASDLRGPSGAHLGRRRLTLYREWYVSTGAGTPNFGGSNPPLPRGRYADGLIPFRDPATHRPLNGKIRAAGVSVSAGHEQPYWVDVTAPAGQRPGRYTGHVTVHSSGGTRSVGVSLQVWNFTLPKHPHLRTAFQNWSMNNAVDKVLLGNRLSPTNVPAANTAAYAHHYGLTANNLGYYSGANNSTCSMDSPPSVSALQSAAAARRAEGVALYDYTADEISQCGNFGSLASSVKQWARALHSAGVKQLVTAAPATSMFSDEAGGNGVDIWVELPEMYQSNPALSRQARRQGMKLWSYNDMNQDSYSPKWEIDFPPINYAIQPGFINQAVGMKGLLYWKVDGWTSDPWHNVDTYQGAYPGEGMLVYPGGQVGLPGGAVPSMRLKYLRDGVNDFDYIQIAKRHGHAKQAMKIVRSVAHDFAHWHHNPAALQRAELRLGRLNSK